MNPIPRLILFDIDGTLIHARGAGQKAFRRALAQELGREIPVLGIDYAGHTDFAILTESLRRLRVRPDPALMQRILDRYAGCLAEELPKVEAPSLCPGVPGILEELSRNGRSVLGVLTGNTLGGARIKLRFFGIDHYFPIGAYGDRNLERRELVEVAMAEAERHSGFGWPHAHVWLVGDTPRDIEAARAAGVHVAAVATGPYGREELARARPDLLFDDLMAPGAAARLAGDAQAPQARPRPPARRRID